jgi:hypothetical protein
MGSGTERFYNTRHQGQLETKGDLAFRERRHVRNEWYGADCQLRTQLTEQWRP